MKGLAMVTSILHFMKHSPLCLKLRQLCDAKSMQPHRLNSLVIVCWWMIHAMGQAWQSDSDCNGDACNREKSIVPG